MAANKDRVKLIAGQGVSDLENKVNEYLQSLPDDIELVDIKYCNDSYYCTALIILTPTIINRIAV